MRHHALLPMRSDDGDEAWRWRLNTVIFFAIGVPTIGASALTIAVGGWSGPMVFVGIVGVVLVAMAFLSAWKADRGNGPRSKAR